MGGVKYPHMPDIASMSRFRGSVGGAMTADSILKQDWLVQSTVLKQRNEWFNFVNEAREGLSKQV